MVVTDYIIGFIEDNAGLFVLPRLISGLKGCTDFVGYPTGLCQNLLDNNQPFIFIPAFILAKLINPMAAYNLVVLAGTGLNFLFAFLFFKKLFGRFIALLLATTLLFSPYLEYQSRAHFDLMQFWPVIWFIDTLLFSKSRHKSIYLGLLLTLTLGLSNYLCYFLLLFTCIYLGLKFVFTRSKVAEIKSTRRGVIKTLAIFVILSAVFMAPYVKSNFFTPRARIEVNTNEKAINRPLEDFITFSSRPWYYLLPSVDNPFFGKLSQDFLNKISRGGNYLTQNYFKAEHSASYLGWINISLGLVGAVFVFKTRKNSGINYLALLLTTAGLVIITMPPAFTVNGITIYTPSYILFKFFPMFRVLSRAGILILFLTLIFTGYGYSALANYLIGKKLQLMTMRLILVFLAVFAMAELFIPLKLTHVGTPPKVYAYLGSNDLLKSPIAVYPYNKSNEAMFWMSTHKQPLINPRLYSDKGTEFDSEDFTNGLITTRGLEKAHFMGTRYLVYFYEDDGNKNTDYFDNNNLLIKVGEFKEYDSGERQILSLVRIVEAGSAVSNSAILYKFR